MLADLARAQAAIGDAAGVETFSAAVDAAEADEERAGLLLGLARAYQDQARFDEAAQTAEQGLRIDSLDDQLRTELTAAYDTAVIWTSGGGEETGAIEQMPGMKERIAEARERLFTGRDHTVAVDLAHQAWAGAAELPGGGADDPTAIRLFALLHNADAEREAIEMADRCLAAARQSDSSHGHRDLAAHARARARLRGPSRRVGDGAPRRLRDARARLVRRGCRSPPRRWSTS